MKKANRGLFKGLLSLTLGIILMGVFGPVVLRIYSSNWPDDRPHPLIILSTHGDNHKYSVQVTGRAQSTGDFIFKFWVKSEEPNAMPGFDVHYQILVASQDLVGDVVCSSSEILREVTPGDLTTGPELALEAFENTLGPLNAREGESAARIVQTSGVIQSRNADEPPSTLESETHSGVLTQECHVDGANVWATNSPSEPLDQSKAVFLAPAFNLVTMSGYPDPESSLAAVLELDRTPGSRMVDAFPPPIPGARYWSLAYEIGGDDTLKISNQPTWLLSNRDAEQRDQTWLFWGGLAIGLGITLLAQGTLDLLSTLGSRRRPTVGEHPPPAANTQLAEPRGQRCRFRVPAALTALAFALIARGIAGHRRPRP